MRPPRRYARTAALMAALACSSAAPTQPGEGRAAREACPSIRLDAFLASFSESSEVQQAFTHFPLKMSWIVDGPDEPETVTDLRERASLRGPVFPSRRTIAADGLVLESRIRDRSAVVTLHKPDSDHQIDYRFVRTDCWYLAEVNDRSL